MQLNMIKHRCYL